MWLKHKKNPMMKRNIRFDDVDMSFCIDFKFPTHKDWISVSYQRTLRDRRASASSELLANEDLLSTAPISDDKERNLEDEQEQSTSAPGGTQAMGGCFASTSWRAPRK